MDQSKVARDYLKRAARIDELNGHPPGSDGQMATALAHTSSLNTDLTRSTFVPHFTPQHWLLCHMGLYQFEFEFAAEPKLMQVYYKFRNARRGSTSSTAIHRAPTGRWSPHSGGTTGAGCWSL